VRPSWRQTTAAGAASPGVARGPSSPNSNGTRRRGGPSGIGPRHSGSLKAPAASVKTGRLQTRAGRPEKNGFIRRARPRGESRRWGAGAGRTDSVERPAGPKVQRIADHDGRPGGAASANARSVRFGRILHIGSDLGENHVERNRRRAERSRQGGQSARPRPQSRRHGHWPIAGEASFVDVDDGRCGRRAAGVGAPPAAACRKRCIRRSRETPGR